MSGQIVLSSGVQMGPLCQLETFLQSSLGHNLSVHSNYYYYFRARNAHSCRMLLIDLSINFEEN